MLNFFLFNMMWWSAFLFLIMCGCSDGNVESLTNSPEIVEKKDKSGRLMIYTRKLSGMLDGLYVWDEGVGRIEGSYSNGVCVGEWREWRSDGTLQSIVSYTFDKTASRAAIWNATYFAGYNKPFCTVSNGVGVVPMFDGSGYIFGFSSIGMTNGYEVQFVPQTKPIIAGGAAADIQMTSCFDDRKDITKIQRLSLYRNTNTLSLEICWKNESSTAIDVYEHLPGKNPSHWGLDVKGNVLFSKGEYPEFLRGAKVAVPTIDKGALHFNHTLVYSNRTTYFYPNSEVLKHLYQAGQPPSQTAQ